MSESKHACRSNNERTISKLALFIAVAAVAVFFFLFLLVVVSLFPFSQEHAPILFRSEDTAPAQG